MIRHYDPDGDLDPHPDMVACAQFVGTMQEGVTSGYIDEELAWARCCAFMLDRAQTAADYRTPMDRIIYGRDVSSRLITLASKYARLSAAILVSEATAVPDLPPTGWRLKNF